MFVPYKGVSLTKKSIKLHFKKILRDGIITNKILWSTMTEVREISETFNKHCVNIVENTSGKRRPMLFIITTFLILTKK